MLIIALEKEMRYCKVRRAQVKPYQTGFIFCESSQSLVGYGKWIIFHFGCPAPGFPFYVWGRSIFHCRSSRFLRLNFSLPQQLHQSEMHLPGSLEVGRVPQESGVMENPSWLWAAALPAPVTAAQPSAQCDHAGPCQTATVLLFVWLLFILAHFR